MSSAYSHLSLTERRTIYRLQNANVSATQIALVLGRHRSTINRELRRNEFREIREYRGYYPLNAHDSARLRRHRQCRLVRDRALCEFVLERLAQWWSPEQIAGRLRMQDQRPCLSHETIYRFIYSSEGRALQLHRHLLRARRVRRPRHARRSRGSRIPLEATIGQRPAQITERSTPGHWEADLMIFQQSNGTANVATVLERKSRYIRLLANRDRRTEAVIGAISIALAPLPAVGRQSITFDRGSEFMGWRALTRSVGMCAYFCDSHAPWQKGSVENTNGRLRRYLPGTTDLTTLKPDRLQQIEAAMNATPRKCLGYRTPAEVFASMAG